MANVIALIWDFDKTLVDGYMQDPIFQHYGVDSSEFWEEVNALPQKYLIEQKVNVNRDTIYLNHFIHYAKIGKFKGLSNNMLEAFGAKLKFYPGIPEIFKRTKEIVNSNPEYKEYNIKVEHYIVSTGMAAIIRGSQINNEVEKIWGCELLEDDFNGERIISEVGYTIDNTTKTRAIFEINKGIPQNPEIDVNAKMPEDVRRVHLNNMIYIADGPSDIPAFSLINKNKGSTFAIYPKGDQKAFDQVERMRMDGRINMYAEANYSDNTTASMWLCYKVKELANKMKDIEKSKITSAVSSAPKHIT